MIDKYAKEMEIDTELSLLNLRDRQLSQPNIRHKWLYRLMQHKRKKAQLNFKLSQIIDNRSQEEIKLSRLSMPKLKAKIDKESDVISIKRQIQEENEVIDYLDSVQSILSSMSFDMKNLVELLKLESL